MIKKTEQVDKFVHLDRTFTNDGKMVLVKGIPVTRYESLLKEW